MVVPCVICQGISTRYQRRSWARLIQKIYTESQRFLYSCNFPIHNIVRLELFPHTIKEHNFSYMLWRGESKFCYPLTSYRHFVAIACSCIKFIHNLNQIHTVYILYIRICSLFYAIYQFYFRFRAEWNHPGHKTYP